MRVPDTLQLTDAGCVIVTGIAGESRESGLSLTHLLHHRTLVKVMEDCLHKYSKYVGGRIGSVKRYVERLK